MSLKNGDIKMSKSDLSEYSRISLLDESDDIIKKIVLMFMVVFVVLIVLQVIFLILIKFQSKNGKHIHY